MYMISGSVPFRMKLSKKAELEIVTSTWGKGKMKLTLSGKGEVLLQEERSLNGEDTCTWEIQDPLLWSAEEPNLYDLELEISDESGKLQEIIPEKLVSAVLK